METSTVRETRKKLKIRQRGAAEMAGVSLSTWARWERTNDPRAWRTIGVEPPDDVEPAIVSRTLNFNLSADAVKAIQSVRAGLRSMWVSHLLETSPVTDRFKSKRR